MVAKSKKESDEFDTLGPASRKRIALFIDAFLDEYGLMKLGDPGYNPKVFRLPFMHGKGPLNGGEALHVSAFINRYFGWGKGKDVEFGPAAIVRWTENVSWGSISIRLRELRSRIGEIYTNDRVAHDKEKKLIEYRDNAFYAKGNLIDFPDPHTDYIVLVKCLIHDSDSGGFISYKDIKKYVPQESEKDNRPSSLLAQNTPKWVSNAISNLYRTRKRQKNRFPVLHDGHKIIKVVPGKGVQFFNPKLDS